MQLHESSNKAAMHAAMQLHKLNVDLRMLDILSSGCNEASAMLTDGRCMTEALASYQLSKLWAAATVMLRTLHQCPHHLCLTSMTPAV